MIWKATPGSERALLGFKEAVLSAFNFLITDYGFRCVKKDITLVRYESKNIFVEAYFNNSTGELEVLLGSSGEHIDNRREFYLYELVHSKDQNVSTGFPMFTAHNHKQMVQSLRQLATLLKKYGKDLLKGDTDKFKQLIKWRQSESDMLTRKMQFGNDRAKADTAWHEKDYAKVIKLYETIKEDLTLIELKRLEYAKRRKSYKS